MAPPPLHVAENWTTWQYYDQWGENWDAQPACIITDYVIAIQSFLLFFSMIRQTHVGAKSGNLNVWYAVYFLTLGFSGLVGGILHTYAYEAFMALMEWDSSVPVTRIELFGIDWDWSRYDVDVLISVIWRGVLLCFLSNTYALICLCATRYFSTNRASQLMLGFAAVYSMIAIWAMIYMRPITFLLGYIPVACFATPVIFLRSSRVKEQTVNGEMIWKYDACIYVSLLSCCVAQALSISPSEDFFNHNALAHAIVSLAAWMMYKQCRLLNDTAKEA